MPRRRRQQSSDHIYFITARCTNRDWFQLPMPRVWAIYSDYLFLLHHAFGVQIYAFVLMDNHFHALIRTPHGNLSEAMNYFMRETSRVLGFETHRINQIYGGPFHSSLIFSPHNYLHAYKYLHRNPVEARLCKRVEDYPYSTLHGLLGKSVIHIPVQDDPLIFEDAKLTNHLNWMNQEYPDADREQIRAAIRRPIFKFARDKHSKRRSHLETDLS